MSGPVPNPQTELAFSESGRIVAADSAYDVIPENRGRDVVVNASYCGVLPARFIGTHMPRGAIGIDCGVGPEGASIAGLWYLEALNIPAVAADVMTVILGDGRYLYENGIVSFVNRPALDCGVSVGMAVKRAAALLLEAQPAQPAAADVTNRRIIYESPSGRAIVCTDSIAFGLDEDRDANVLVTAGHTGRSAAQYIKKILPYGFICSDGGRGKNDSGMAGMYLAEEFKIPGATVDARRARMGDARSTYEDGIISAHNRWAAQAGVETGMRAAIAAQKLVDREPYDESG